MTVDPDIEADYVFSNRYPERVQVYARIDEMSIQARMSMRGALDLAYGDDPLERLDLFPGTEGRALVVFIHGGYWRSMDKRSFSFVARPLVELGYSVAVLNYPLAPDASISRIVESVHRALDWIGEHGHKYLPQHGQTVLAGHSAGGHLAACVAGMRGTASGVAGCVCISGIFDLGPIMKTTIAAQVRLKTADVSQFSPISNAPFDGWMLLAVGAQETAGFIDTQTSRFVNSRAVAGASTQTMMIAGANHYTVLMELADGNHSLVQAMLANMPSRASAHDR